MTDIIVGFGGEVKSFFYSLNALAAGILGLGATSEARGKWFCSATHVPLALFDVLFTLNDRTAGLDREIVGCGTGIALKNLA